MSKIEYEIAKLVDEKGGKTFYVGGFVRDEIMHKENKDVDIEIHGIKPDELLNILKQVGEPLSYGKQFGVYSLKGENIDIALPRKETNIGTGHKDFEIYVDPYIDIEKAISRRDFTINAIYKNILTGEIIDPFNGVEDINNKLIRHVNDDKFCEDPLRVFRGCGFASRFEYKIESKTLELCKTINTNNLPKQRVNEETRKALLQSKNPSLYFSYLEKMNQLNNWFEGINISLIDKANTYIENINNKYEYLLSSIVINTNYNIKTLTDDNNIINYVENMKENINVETNNDYEIYSLFNKLTDINDYIYLKIAINENNKYLLVKYESYKALINKPCVMGKDLIELGYKPGDYFNDALSYGQELRLRGIDKKEALNKVIDYIEKNK